MVRVVVKAIVVEEVVLVVVVVGLVGLVLVVVVVKVVVLVLGVVLLECTGSSKGRGSRGVEVNVVVEIVG